MSRSADGAFEIAAALREYSCVKSVELAGSRARGDPCEHSDWDFLIETSDFARLRADLPRALSAFEPLAMQWDRLSSIECFMLLLKGPRKVGLIFPSVLYTREPALRAS